jgi:hypothetical protein
MRALLRQIGVKTEDDAFSNPTEILHFFNEKKNQFYSSCTVPFPELTPEEEQLVYEERELFFFRDGLSIFGSKGLSVRRKMPPPEIPVTDLTEENETTPPLETRITDLTDENDLSSYVLSYDGYVVLRALPKFTSSLGQPSMPKPCRRT